MNVTNAHLDLLVEDGHNHLAVDDREPWGLLPRPHPLHDVCVAREAVADALPVAHCREEVVEGEHLELVAPVLNDTKKGKRGGVGEVRGVCTRKDHHGMP